MDIKDGILINKNPVTKKEISRHKVAGDNEIKNSFVSAYKSQKKWQELKLKDRLIFLGELQQNIVDNTEKIIDTVYKDTGKKPQETLTADILPVLRMLRYYKKNAAKILKRQKRNTPLLAPGSTSYVEYFPRGIIAIISPWNYPFQLTAIPAITALTAGNAVVIKPSELTPLTGKLLENIFNSLDSLPENLVNVFQGGGGVGSKMIENKPDMIFFTGSVETGRKVMKQAAEYTIPVELELGGKDPMLVLKDANIERAARAAAYGGFTNAGQLCVSVERVYVAEEIYENFLDILADHKDKIRWNRSDRSGDYGPFIHPQQSKKVRKLVNDALSRGANLIGDMPSEDQSAYFPPLILTGVNEEMKIMQEEIFGPVLTLSTFSTEEEAINMANSSGFGLNASIFCSNVNKAKEIASKLETGNCIINDVLRNVANPELPFGGVKNSGTGRYHGPEGLKNFSNTRSIMINKSDNDRELNWFPFSEGIYQDMEDFIRNFYAEDSIFKVLTSGFKIMKRFIKTKFFDDK